MPLAPGRLSTITPGPTPPSRRDPRYKVGRAAGDQADDPRPASSGNLQPRDRRRAMRSRQAPGCACGHVMGFLVPRRAGFSIVIGLRDAVNQRADDRFVWAAGRAVHPNVIDPRLAEAPESGRADSYGCGTSRAGGMHHARRQSYGADLAARRSIALPRVGDHFVYLVRNGNGEPVATRAASQRRTRSPFSRQIRAGDLGSARELPVRRQLDASAGSLITIC